MNDEYIRLDTTIIAIDNLINEAATGTMARTLFKAKDTIYNQQRYVIDLQPVKRGRWIGINEYCKKNGYIPSGMGIYYWCDECGKEEPKISDYCPNCGARMGGDAE